MEVGDEDISLFIAEDDVSPDSPGAGAGDQDSTSVVDSVHRPIEEVDVKGENEKPPPQPAQQQAVAGVKVVKRGRGRPKHSRDTKPRKKRGPKTLANAKTYLAYMALFTMAALLPECENKKDVPNPTSTCSAFAPRSI